MKIKSMLPIKITLVIALTLAVHILLYFVFIGNINYSLRENLSLVTTHKMEAYSDVVNVKLQQTYSDLNLTKNVEGVEFWKLSDRQSKLSATVANNLSNFTLNFYAPVTLGMNDDSEIDFVFTKKINEVVYIFNVDISAVTAILPSIDIDSVAIVSPSAKVQVLLSGSGDIFTLLNPNDISAEATTKSIINSSSEYLMTVTNNSIFNQAVYLSSFDNIDEIGVLMSKRSGELLLLLGLSFLTLSAIVIVCSIGLLVRANPKTTAVSVAKVKSNVVKESTAEGAKSVQSKYNEALKSGQVLYGIVEITNLASFNSMFGEEFCQVIVDNIFNKLEEKFINVYFLPPQTFSVVLGDGKDFTYVMSDIRQVCDYFNKPIKIDNNLVSPICKEGFTLIDNYSENRELEYVNNGARAALKRAREEKFQSYFVYHESQKRNYQKYFPRRYDIAKMLEDENFEVEFQPQFAISDNKVVGFESLLRVKKQHAAEVDVYSLITFAEKSGNMIFLGNFIYEQAMAFAKSIEGSGVKVSLNISPLQLMQAGFVENFLKIYNSFAFKPHSICIEITESLLMSTFDETLQKLQILFDTGVDIHLDDFGVSYSSLLYLKMLPINAIKIDREFIIDIQTNKYSKSIVELISNLSHELGLETICEGVEKKEQLDILKELKCTTIQGFLSGKSMSAENARRLL